MACLTSAIKKIYMSLLFRLFAIFFVYIRCFNGQCKCDILMCMIVKFDVFLFHLFRSNWAASRHCNRADIVIQLRIFDVICIQLFHMVFLLFGSVSFMSLETDWKCGKTNARHSFQMGLIAQMSLCVSVSRPLSPRLFSLHRSFHFKCIRFR